MFPALKRPDTKYSELGEYKANLSMPMAEAQPIIDKLEAIYKAHVGKPHPKNPESDNRKAFWYIETDKEGNETGNAVFKIKVKNRTGKGGDLWDRRPKMFDAALKPIDVNPWSGTTMIVSAEIYLWSTPDGKGMSLQPMGVQIIDLVSGGDGVNPEDMGFSKQDGFTADEDDIAGDFRGDDGEGADDGDY